MGTKQRSANAAIKGYVYQFDKTILEILGAKQSSVVTVEGLEDIDIESATANEAVQCKYLSASKFSLATIRDPVLLMLNHSSKHSGANYRLYIYCADSNDFKSFLTVEELKSCLTKQNRVKGIVEEFHTAFSDKTLSTFVSCFRIESGSDFSVQQATTRKALATALNCSLEDCADIFYPMALSIVLGLAVMPKMSTRKITRKDLVSQLSVRHRVYSRWHAEEVGVDRFVSGLKRQLKMNQALSPLKARALVIDTSDESLHDELVRILVFLATISYGPGKLTNAKPWTVVASGPDRTVAALKRLMVGRNLEFNDGYEMLAFNPGAFESMPVINTRQKAKIIALSSYSIRIVSLKTYRRHSKQIRKPDSVISLTSGSIVDPKDTIYLTNIPYKRITEILGT